MIDMILGFILAALGFVLIVIGTWLFAGMAVMLANKWWWRL